jgi:hypothetical protein
MYSVDDKDTVVKLHDTPQSSVGAPCPVIFATEHTVHLAYYIQETPAGWDGSSVRVIDEHTVGEPIALVSFVRPHAHMFGPPNDEAFSGHPLASRGLQPYSVCEIRESSWIRLLERMNAVHPFHKPERFVDYRHFIFSFHDRTFECVANNFTISVHTGSVIEIIELALRQGRKYTSP